jgi:hypothetical protein
LNVFSGYLGNTPLELALKCSLLSLDLSRRQRLPPSSCEFLEAAPQESLHFIRWAP